MNKDNQNLAEIDSMYNSHIIELLNKAVVAATDGDLHLQFDKTNRTVLLLTRVSQVRQTISINTLTPVELMGRLTEAVRDNLH